MTTNQNIRNRAFQIGAYLFWGVCTTGVNVLVFRIIRVNTEAALLWANFAAWCSAVVFAFIATRTFVFKPGTSSAPDAFFREFALFIAARISTGAADMLCMWLGSEILHIHELGLKIAVNALVIAGNYLLSLFFVFRRRSRE